MKNNSKKIKTIDIVVYTLIAILILLNIFIFQPIAMAISLFGTIMGGGYVFSLFYFIVSFIVAIIPYLILC